jgi:hypothetical protein
MGYFLLELALFVPGLIALVVGKVPLTRRRAVHGSAARLVGILLLGPLPLYLVACGRSQLAPLGEDPLSPDPLRRAAQGFVRLAALVAAFASLLAAAVLALATSEDRRRPKRWAGRARTGGGRRGPPPEGVSGSATGRVSAGRPPPPGTLSCLTRLAPASPRARSMACK